jgi:hypothetical protein
VNTPIKVAAFGAALGVMFAGAYGAGAVAGPVTAAEPGGHEATSAAADEHGAAQAHAAKPSVSGPAGLAVSADGYSLRQTSSSPVAGPAGEFAFQVVDADGRPVTGFQESHEKRLHLIVVRRDMMGFQHLHPVMSADGTWRTPLDLPAAGDWRVFADFLPTGRDQQVVLGFDVPVAGAYQPQPLPPASATATIDGYTITVDGTLTAGHTSRLTLNVTRGDAPVTDLQPYLGAFGHLVALRTGDLGYLHVHPQHSEPAGPSILFDVEVPTAGAYRLFLDFQHGGVVRTAAFTATAA